MKTTRAPLFILPFVAIGACRSRTHNAIVRDDKPAPGLHDLDGFKISATVKKCDVIIAGGTTAATAAAISAATEFKERGGGGLVCLIEPTDWPGGQLTASGVAAVDFDHHSARLPGLKEKFVNEKDKSVHIGTIARNHSFVFERLMRAVGLPSRHPVFNMNENKARCLVSARCFLPADMVKLIQAEFKPFEDSGNLFVSNQTVVKALDIQGRRITSVYGIIRKPKPPVGNGYGVLFSQLISDWYDTKTSANFDKEPIVFKGKGTYPVVIDATECRLPNVWWFHAARMIGGSCTVSMS